MTLREMGMSQRQRSLVQTRFIVRSSTPSDERGRFEGVVMRFAPDGTYSNAIPELRARDLISAS
jgi:hypothetical protein